MNWHENTVILSNTIVSVHTEYHAHTKQTHDLQKENEQLKRENELLKKLVELLQEPRYP